MSSTRSVCGPALTAANDARMSMAFAVARLPSPQAACAVEVDGTLTQCGGIAENRVRLARESSGARLLQDGAQPHGEPYIAGHLELALHEGAGGVELARRHLVEIVEAHADGA